MRLRDESVILLWELKKKTPVQPSPTSSGLTYTVMLNLSASVLNGVDSFGTPNNMLV